MGLKIEKKAPVATAVTDSLVEQAMSPAVVDEYLNLTTELEKAAKKLEAKSLRHAALKKQMQALADEQFDPEQKVVFNGTGKQAVEFSAKSNQTLLTDLEGAKKFLGKDLFFKIAKIGIGDLKDYLTKPQLEQVTTTELTGARRCKIVPL